MISIIDSKLYIVKNVNVANVIASADIKINLDSEENDEDLSECSLSTLES